MPITTFTDKQCNTIQRPMINAALPKLRINRNMPQTVVFGPLRYGGLDILSLSTEQLCKHTKMTLSHLRSKSSTGTSMHHFSEAFSTNGSFWFIGIHQIVCPGMNVVFLGEPVGQSKSIFSDLKNHSCKK